MKGAYNSTFDRAQAERPSTTSLNLLLRIKDAQPAAWQRLNRLYAPLVWRWCRQRDLRDKDAEDVLQEVFHTVYRRVNTFERERDGSFRKWLLTITTNKIGDLIRRQVRQVPATGGSDANVLLAEVPAPKELESDAAEERTLLIRQARDLARSQFESRTWQAFECTVVHGRNTQDVARELGMTVNAVWVAKSKILSYLREEFSDLLD